MSDKIKKIKRPNEGKVTGKSPKKLKLTKDEGEVKNFSKPLKPKGKSAGTKGKPGQLTEKPADWNEFKKKKKEVRMKRKQSNTFYDVITKAKQIGEELRLKKLDGGTEKRNKLVNELHVLLGKQGNYVKFVLAHDMARIVQYLLKFGNQTVREEVANELIPETVQLLQSKYGKFCIKRMLKYGNATVRGKCVQACYGHAVKLTSHAVSAPVFEFAYSTYASATDKINLIQEFFGDMYKQTKDVNVKHLRDVYTKSPDMKNAALGATKANLSRILNKDLLDSGLVQSVLAQFFSECTKEDRTELITQLAPHIVVLSNSRDGSRVAMQIIWHGTNKDRKIAMKALKENVIELCKHEHGHSAVIGLIDAADDTVLVNKMILTEIFKQSKDLVGDDWGRKVLLWLVTPADKTHFHPQFIQELKTGRENSSCKKEAEIRRKEILDYCSKNLLTSIIEEPREWLNQASKAVVTLAILKTASIPELSSALKAISTEITNEDFKLNLNESEVYAIEHPGLHMTLKKLAVNDKIVTENSLRFGSNIIEFLTDEVIKTWVKLNRGCFLLLALYENNSEDVQLSLKTKLEKQLKLVKKQKTAGSELLVKIVFK